MANLDSELGRAAALTFECLSFMLPTEDAASNSLAPPAARAGVRFDGPFAGELIVLASEDLLPALAANMLGSDGPPPSAQQLDALGEVANVVCGNLLPAIGGRQQVFRIEPPRVLAGPASTPPSQGVAATARLVLDEGWADLWLLLDS